METKPKFKVGENVYYLRRFPMGSRILDGIRKGKITGVKFIYEVDDYANLEEGAMSNNKKDFIRKIDYTEE